MSNPYESPSENRDETDETRKGLSKWFTVPVGFIGGGVLAAIVSTLPASVVLIPTLSRMLGLGGEFDSLWLMGIPVCTLACGAIGGLVLGCTWRWRPGFALAVVGAGLPAAIYFLENAWNKEWTKNPHDVFVSNLFISSCVALSAAAGLMLLKNCFSAMERNRGA